MDIHLLLNQLIAYGLQKELLGKHDIIPIRNTLMDILQLDAPAILEETYAIAPIDEKKIPQIRESILDYCVQQKLIAGSVVERDLMDAKIMGALMPRATETISQFYTLYETSPENATAYLYNQAVAANYIQMARIKKNLEWTVPSPYGELEITINLSKPEKDPRDIEKAKYAAQTGYPQCLLCKENAGFAGTVHHPARQNLRLIPIQFQQEEWFLQYSPYAYYQEHCIILSPRHEPMKITKDTFHRLITFIQKFPHYFIGSNADLPIVGGSILTHDHYQGGNHVFPMAKAGVTTSFSHKNFPGLHIGKVNWPMTAIRVSANEGDIGQLADFSWHIFRLWQCYSDIEANIHAATGDINHNTITPLARRNKAGRYEIDLVLRNNRTSAEHPLGIFHPHERLHHIKKENIGLIEVMGLAILPGRLQEELAAIQAILAGAAPTAPIGPEHPLYIHKNWLDELTNKYGAGNTPETARNIVQAEVGKVFEHVLADCAVFPNTAAGGEHFLAFARCCGLVPQ